MTLREKIQQYFKMTDEEKDTLLVTIVDEYRNIILRTGETLEQIINRDIQFFIENDEFEAVQALTDIKQVLDQINREYGL
jgi:hypothetical protein